MEYSQQAEHVVFFPAPDGSPAFRRVASLAEAALLVEHLRNVEGVDEVGVHRLAEVPLAFKPYYRVELLTEVAAPPAPEPGPERVPTLAPEQVFEAEPEPVLAPRLPAAADGLDESLAQLLASVPTTEQPAGPSPADQPEAEEEQVEEEPLAAAGSTVLPAETHHRSRGLGFFTS